MYGERKELDEGCSKERKEAEGKIRIWLSTLVVITFVIVLLGGATRLTGSGLSMVDLKLLMGVIPPLSEEDWANSFSGYKDSAEYRITYSGEGMDLEGYKSIFWLEYLHRLIGRVLGGIIFLVPFIYFVIRYYLQKRVLTRKEILKFLMMFVLGALQGFVGWIMVKSGLDESSAHIQGGLVNVSPYRLTLHLSFALLIYLYILWLLMSFSSYVGEGDYGGEGRYSKGLYIGAIILTVLISLTIVSGGVVAGIKAGMVSKTFPLMLGNFDGYMVPPGLYSLEPWHLNFWENKLNVQFNHRMLAYLVLIYIGILFVLFKRKGFLLRTKLPYILVFIGFIQVILGVITLLHFLPKSGTTVLTGTLHQGVGFLLLTVSFIISARLRHKV